MERHAYRRRFNLESCGEGIFEGVRTELVQDQAAGDGLFDGQIGLIQLENQVDVVVVGR